MQGPFLRFENLNTFYSENLTFFKDLRKLKMGPLSGLMAAKGAVKREAKSAKTQNLSLHGRNEY